ncbi:MULTISPECIES: rod shape-determining protein MreD [Acinetobacter]|uniref:rod shape-determining protein MreD n=1 Tax=Acinetobacter TaxID=469 RepID=UPI0009940193|nr:MULTISPECIES: rod shape-determining protein MreD [Acinetobacter]MCL6238088.1 rod shape-determining protein MreD [Acinetobacter amyesii]MCL6246140.1 rod shape-determining protein MreD [Acinetobacter amyesii]OOV82188.1 rod shape-determining protein MreD [Acinetobacter sp. ANC 5600]
MSLAKLSRHTERDPLFPIIISIILASVLMVYPLSYDLSGWRPLFMMMIMLFWVLCQPTWCGVWFAFATGLFTDLLTDAPFGMNALSFVVIAFVTRFLTRERRILTFGNLWIIAAMAIFAHLLFVWIVQVMGGAQFSFARHWQPIVTSLLIWPIMYYFLRKWRI